MTARLSSEALAAGWGASADLARLAQAKAENDALLASEGRAAAIDTDRDPTIGILVVIAGLLFGVLALMADAIFVGAWLLGAT